MIEPERALARARAADAACPAATRCSARRSSRRSPRGSRRPSSAWAASGAPSGCSGRPTASTRRPSATPAATRRTRPTRRCARARPATPRSCWSRSTRTKTSYEEHAADLLGGPRPDPGHAPGQRRRHAVPLGDLLDAGRTARAAPRRRARCTRSSSSAAGHGEITTEIAEAGPFYYAEDYHQQYLAKNPNGYCGLGGTGVSCPVGLATCRASATRTQHAPQRLRSARRPHRPSSANRGDHVSASQPASGPPIGVEPRKTIE